MSINTDIGHALSKEQWELLSLSLRAGLRVSTSTAPVLNLSPSEYRRARNPGNHIERATFNRYWREG